jgi:hypothetical protein
VTGVPLWTVDEAAAVFARQGQPVDPWRLRLMIRAASLQPAARTQSGEQGGRGKALYPAGAFQRMHALLTDLTPSPGRSGET